jgi:hypothetical protein
MLEDLNPTTRCYPRTMNEAFPDDVGNAEWFFPPERNTTTASIIVGGTGLSIWLGLAYLFAKN